VQKGKELNDFQRNPLDIEILSNLRFGSLEIRDTSVTRVTNNDWNPSGSLGSGRRMWKRIIVTLASDLRLVCHGRV
jgi:hypothetical protein